MFYGSCEAYEKVQNRKQCCSACNRSQLCASRVSWLPVISKRVCHQHARLSAGTKGAGGHGRGAAAECVRR